MQVRSEGAEVLQSLDPKAVHVFRAEDGFIKIPFARGVAGSGSRYPYLRKRLYYLSLQWKLD